MERSKQFEHGLKKKKKKKDEIEGEVRDASFCEDIHTKCGIMDFFVLLICGFFAIQFLFKNGNIIMFLPFQNKKKILQFRTAKIQRAKV